MIRVAVGIIMNNSSALLCQRKASSRYGLKWEFPGGKVEKNETAEECLRRELLEELGITAEIGPLFSRQHSTYPDGGKYDVCYYLIHSFSGEIVNHVFEDYRWVSVSQLLSFEILDGNREVVTKLIEEYASAKHSSH